MSEGAGPPFLCWNDTLPQSVARKHPVSISFKCPVSFRLLLETEGPVRIVRTDLLKPPTTDPETCLKPKVL
jgi:hypothetical protein